MERGHYIYPGKTQSVESMQSICTRANAAVQADAAISMCKYEGRLNKKAGWYKKREKIVPGM